MARKTARRTAGRKTAKKKAAPRKTTSKAAPRKPGKIAAASKPRSKSEVMSTIAEQTGLSKKEVSSVFDAMGALCKADLSKSGPGVVNLGGMMKVMVQRKPATKARMGINPFTGEQTMFKAKPARNVVKVRPMKALKDLV